MNRDQIIIESSILLGRKEITTGEIIDMNPPGTIKAFLEDDDCVVITVRMVGHGLHPVTYMKKALAEQFSSLI